MKVALRKESVDRNKHLENRAQDLANVALRKESVDRNTQNKHPLTKPIESLSARRAWIEICPKAAPSEAPTTSLSARRAWIEIKNGTRKRSFGASLSARRAWIEMFLPWVCCPFELSRSPQGERG